MNCTTSIKFATLTLVGIVVIATPAMANVVFPDMLYVETIWTNLWLIAVAMLIEWPMVKHITKYPWMKALIPLLVANFASATFGLAATWYFGKSILQLVWTFPALMKGYAVSNLFYISHFALSMLAIVLINALVEFMALAICFRSKVSVKWKTFGWICIAQILSLTIIIAAGYYKFAKVPAPL